MLRDKVMMEAGEFFGDERDGVYLQREIDHGVRRRPVV